jgi:hypothetical protein
VVILSLLVVHVARLPRVSVREELWVLGCACIGGFVVDTVFLQLGVFHIAGRVVSPPWLVLLWPNMAAATAPRGSLAALARRPWVAAAAGAIAAPLSYEAGARLGAVTLLRGSSSLVILAVVWAAVLPAIFLVRVRVRKAQTVHLQRGDQVG